MDVKHAKHEVERLANEIRDLQAVFQKLQECFQKPTLATNLPNSASLQSTTEQALKDIKRLENILDPGNGAKVMKRVGKRALKWPLEKKEVNEWVAKLERHKTLLNLALSADELYEIALIV